MKHFMLSVFVAWSTKSVFLLSSLVNGSLEVIVVYLKGGIFIPIGWTYDSHLPKGSQLCTSGNIQSTAVFSKKDEKITKLWLI